MNILADESVDLPIVIRLRNDGHQVSAIAEESPGASDDDVLNRAHRDGVLLITADKDFGELVYRHGRPHAGILLLRLSGTSEAEKCELTSRAVSDQGLNLSGAFSVLTEDALRIRNPPSI